MEIQVDNRERDQIRRFGDFFAKNRSNIVTGMEVVQLNVGDVCTKDNMIGIERKAGDFVESTFSKKLDQQLKELRDNFQYPFLFIEYDGIISLIEDNLGVNPKSLIGEFTSIMARHRNVTVMFTGNYSSIKEPQKPHPLFVPFTIRVIEKFYDGKNKVKETEYTPIRQGHRPSKRGASPTEVKLDLISRIPKIGRKKSFELLEHFDWSINKISQASIDDIMEIKGVGHVLAQQIKDVLK